MKNTLSLTKISKILRIFIGISLLSVLIYLTDGSNIVSQIRKVNRSYLIIAIVLIFLAFIAGMVNFYILITKRNSIKLLPYIRCFWIAWSAGLLIPGQVGDVATLSIWLKKNGVPLSKGIAYTLIDKLISLVCLATIGAYGGVFLSNNRSVITIIAILLIIPVVLISTISISKKIRLNSNKGRIVSIIYEMLAIIKDSPSRYSLNFCITIIKFFLIGASTWFIFKGLGEYNIGLIATTAIISASTLVAYIPVSINGLGTVEWSAIYLFSILSIKDNHVISTILLFRVSTLVLALIPSAMFFILYKADTTNVVKS